MQKKYTYLSAAIGLALGSVLVINFISSSLPLTLESVEVSESQNKSMRKIETFAVTDTDWTQLKTFRQAGIDGGLKLDELGNLVVDRDLRHWFDFYLSAIGEVGLEVIIDKMKEDIGLLPSPAHEQALKLLENYLAYKTELADYETREALSISDEVNLRALSDRLDWQKRLRRQWFDQESVEAFWQLDEMLDDYAQQRLLITTSMNSPEIIEEKLSSLDADLPDEYKAYRQELTQVVELDSAESFLKQNSEDTNELQLKIQALRKELVGEDAMYRLHTLDQQQASWQGRIQTYQVEFDRINNLQGLSSQDKDKMIIDYQQVHFDDKERLRLKAALTLMASD